MTNTMDDPGGLSLYEKAALDEIEAWKNPPSSWLTKATDVLSWPLDKAGELALDAPGVGFVLRKTVGGLVDLGNEVAQWSIRPEAIYSEFRAAGHTGVHAGAGIHGLDLRDVDRVVGYLGAKYKGIAAGEGAATGAIGMPGIPPDIIALITLNLRAIGEYATYYGFDVSAQHERLFAMNVLGLASSPTDSSKALAMAQLVKIAQDVAKKKAWRELQKHAFVKVIQQIAKALGIRLTKAKLAQVIPAMGAAVGAGFNAYFTSKVCDAAYNLYRERFLAEKYGPEIIRGGSDLVPGDSSPYPEADEDLPDDPSSEPKS